MTIKAEAREALFAGLRAKDARVVREILEEGFDPNEADINGWTAFHEAVSSGSSSVTLAFLRYGAKTDLQDKYGNTPLHLSAQRGHTKIAQMLLDNNAEISLQNKDGKTAEDLASSACKELLQRKRIEVMMRSDKARYTKSFQDGSFLQMNPTRCGSPSKSQQERMLSQDKELPSPGEVKLSFEYNRRLTSLKVNILEIKDLKLPIINNYSHVYVKCCLVPDKEKETKGKTSLFKVDSSMGDDGYGSRGSSASSQSSMTSTSSLDFDTQIADKIMSVLKKRPHLHKKKKNEVKCFVNQSDNSIGRISVSIYESLTYDGLVLRKLNNNTQSQIYVRVCGKNRWTHKGATIAEAFVPLAVAIKKSQTPMSFYLDYKISVPVTPEEEKQHSQMNQSWELKEGGQYTGRGLAWNMDIEPDCTTTTFCQTKTTSVPDISAPKRKYHSKAARFLKGELKLFKSKPNERYDSNNSKHQDSTETVETISDRVIDNPLCNDQVQTIGHDSSESSFVSHSGYGQCDSNSIDNVFQVTQRIEDPTMPRPSLKYSRAFGNQSIIGRATKTLEQDVSIEDVDDDLSQDLSQSKIKARTKLSKC